MTGSQATAEVFITALKSLSKKERNSVLVRGANSDEQVSRPPKKTS